jgi:hypothetical protein
MYNSSTDDIALYDSESGTYCSTYFDSEGNCQINYLSESELTESFGNVRIDENMLPQTDANTVKPETRLSHVSINAVGLDTYTAETQIEDHTGAFDNTDKWQEGKQGYYSDANSNSTEPEKSSQRETLDDYVDSIAKQSQSEYGYDY